jgi:hypothetical protein
MVSIRFHGLYELSARSLKDLFYKHHSYLKLQAPYLLKALAYTLLKFESTSTYPKRNCKSGDIVRYQEMSLYIARCPSCAVSHNHVCRRKLVCHSSTWRA